MEGGEDSFLTLTGACSQTQAQATSLDFRAAVRGSTTQSITLANPSVTPWQLKPLIQNDYWSGPEVLTVPAGAEAAYAITYRPLSMSTQEKQHEGSVFFPIPDGTGLLYRLAGVAQSPLPAGTIQCQVNPLTLTLLVHMPHSVLLAMAETYANVLSKSTLYSYRHAKLTTVRVLHWTLYGRYKASCSIAAVLGDRWQPSKPTYRVSRWLTGSTSPSASRWSLTCSRQTQPHS